jgi:lysophospholipase L1-like esterase
MNTILCYGDSNTWGANPLPDGPRYGRDVRWPGRLQDHLGADYYVIEEGLGGRTTVWDDPIEEGRSGKAYLLPCLESHRPLNLVILMLGTNDLKSRFNLQPSDVARGAELLVQKIQASKCGPNDSAPPILLISPILAVGLNATFAEMFQGAEEKSKHLAPHYQAVAQAYGCRFLDAAGIAQPAVGEGLHLDAEGHALLAHVLAPMVRHMLMT